MTACSLPLLGARQGHRESSPGSFAALIHRSLTARALIDRRHLAQKERPRAAAPPALPDSADAGRDLLECSGRTRVQTGDPSYHGTNSCCYSAEKIRTAKPSRTARDFSSGRTSQKQKSQEKVVLPAPVSIERLSLYQR